MQVVLLQDVEKVGLRGDVVDVARGYARNFLLPRKLAQPATPVRIAELGKVQATRARHEAQTFEQARELADSLAKITLRFEVKAGSQGTLFGSVTATNIADELWNAHKIRVDRRKIELPDPIKRVGRYEVPIELFQDVRVEVQTHVVPEGGELPPQEEEVPAGAARPVGEGEASPAEDEAPAEAEEAEPAG